MNSTRTVRSTDINSQTGCLAAVAIYPIQQNGTTTGTPTIRWWIWTLPRKTASSVWFHMDSDRKSGSMGNGRWRNTRASAAVYFQFPGYLATAVRKNISKRHQEAGERVSNALKVFEKEITTITNSISSGEGKCGHEACSGVHDFPGRQQESSHFHRGSL